MTKPTKWHVRPAKTQISLGICPHEDTLDPYPSIERSSKTWSDWVDAQADLSLRWAHTQFCWFCHVVPQFYWQFKAKIRCSNFQFNIFSLLYRLGRRRVRESLHKHTHTHKFFFFFFFNSHMQKFGRVVKLKACIFMCKTRLFLFFVKLLTAVNNIDCQIYTQQT